MADVTKTYLTSDWKIWTYQPTSTAFVLNVSKLNGADVLGNTGTETGTLKVLDCSISNLTITEGTNVDLFSVPSVSPPRLNATFIVDSFTNNQLRNYYINKRIYVTHKNAQTFEDAYWGTNSVYFEGVIEDVQVECLPGEQFTSVSIIAVSGHQNVFNTQVTITKDVAVNKGELLRLYASPNPYYRVSYSQSPYYFANNDTETKTVGDWIADQLACELTVPFWFTGVTGTNNAGLVFYGTSLIIPSSISTPAAASVTLDESTIRSYTAEFQGASSATTLDLSLLSNSSTTYKYTSPSTTSNVQSSYSANLDVANLNELTNIGQRMLQFESSYSPSKVTCINSTNNQEITFKEVVYNINGTNTSYWLYPTDRVLPGEKIKIDLSNFGFDIQEMFVSYKTTEITPDTWTTTYDLWKGFTN